VYIQQFVYVNLKILLCRYDISYFCKFGIDIVFNLFQDQKAK